jgi:hypothetical protein
MLESLTKVLRLAEQMYAGRTHTGRHGGSGQAKNARSRESDLSAP